MGYSHRARKVTCGNCKRQVAWFWDKVAKITNTWTCSCGSTNYLKAMPDWPNVPRTLYIGPDKFARFKVYPLPPESPHETWAQPYSVRSFVSQASHRFGRCYYQCSHRGEVMDEIVFSDACHDQDPSDGDYCDSHQCHLVAGWTTGQDTCPLWQEIAKLCQTDTEKKFLHRYLAYVKDRQFPMLIPQTWIGIAERRRPDFVAFVPLQYWNYKWIAIQLDGAHGVAQEADDSARDQYVADKNYEVLSLKPNEKGYLEEVRCLVEKIENWMNLGDTDPWKVAVEAEVTRTVNKQSDDIPF
jgi:rRNA maturation endonuclease Nob1